MAFDFKKEYRDLYQAKTKPVRVEVPAMTFAAVAGTGDPNEEGGAYARALALLYGFSYTVKMAKMGSWQPDGYFDYVVPPLEGLWWGGAGAFDGTVIADKGALSWVSLIRQPDFVTPDVFIKVCELLVQKKPELAVPVDQGDLRLVRFAEGSCAQIMHRGPYDDEPATIAKLSSFIESEGLVMISPRAASLRRGMRRRGTSMPLRCSMLSMCMVLFPRSDCITRYIWGTRGVRSPRISRR